MTMKTPRPKIYEMQRFRHFKGFYYAQKIIHSHFGPTLIKAAGY